MNSIKKNSESFILETHVVASMGLVRGMNILFSVDITKVLESEATLEIQSKSSSAVQKVNLIDVEYKYDKSKSRVIYKLIFRDSFDNIKSLTMYVSRIDAPFYSYPFIKYYIYDNKGISYIFVFQFNNYIA